MSTPAPTDRRIVSTRWGFWVLVVFGLQTGFVLWVSRQTPPRMGSKPISGIQLIEGVNHKLLHEMAHEDPELLSQPNPQGFSEIWLKPRPLVHHPYRWSPPDIELPYPSNLVYAPLYAALASNAPPRAVAFLKPQPKLSPMDVPSLELRRSNWLEITGDLKNRQLAKSVPLISTWIHKELLKPTIIQVMVDANGVVFTGSLIGLSGYDIADKVALEIALQTVRFQRLTNASPDAPLTTGDLIFHWHGNLNSVTNLMKRPR